MTICPWSDVLQIHVDRDVIPQKAQAATRSGKSHLLLPSSDLVRKS